MDQDLIQDSVNRILQKKDNKTVNNFAVEFADGKLFLQLFNQLFAANMKIQLKESPSLENSIQNWNQINQNICHNYFKKRFYLLDPTISKLAQG